MAADYFAASDDDAATNADNDAWVAAAACDGAASPGVSPAAIDAADDAVVTAAIAVLL